MVAAVPQDAILNYRGSDSVKRSRCQRYQYKTTCETLLRLVDASLTPAELEANASPSAKFVIGNELVQPTSSDEIVKARCSCVDGSNISRVACNELQGLGLHAPLSA